MSTSFFESRRVQPQKLQVSRCAFRLIGSKCQKSWVYTSRCFSSSTVEPKQQKREEFVKNTHEIQNRNPSNQPTNRAGPKRKSRIHWEKQKPQKVIQEIQNRTPSNQPTNRAGPKPQSRIQRETQKSQLKKNYRDLILRS